MATVERGLLILKASNKVLINSVFVLKEMANFHCGIVVLLPETTAKSIMQMLSVAHGEKKRTRSQNSNIGFS